MRKNLVSLAVLLALSLSFVTAGPSMAQESPEQSASIYPQGATYDLDAPADFISSPRYMPSPPIPRAAFSSLP